MKHKKTVCGVLAMLACLALFAGCAGKGAESPAPDDGGLLLSEEVVSDAASPDPESIVVEPIAFTEASEEYTKAKSFYGYYILQDSDVIFAMNEEESRFCVKFYAFAGRPMVLAGSVENGLCTVDLEYNGLFGEDVQLMYEDAMEEPTPWAPIARD